MAAAPPINKYFTLTVTISPFCAFLAFCRTTANCNHTSGGRNNSTAHSTASTAHFCRHQAIPTAARRGIRLTRPTVLAVEGQHNECTAKGGPEVRVPSWRMWTPEGPTVGWVRHLPTMVPLSLCRGTPKEGRSHKLHLS